MLLPSGGAAVESEGLEDRYLPPCSGLKCGTKNTALDSTALRSGVSV